MQTQSGTIKLTHKDNAWTMDIGQGLQGPDHYPALSVPYDQTADFSFQIVGSPGVTFAATDPFQAKSNGNGKSDFKDQFDVSQGGERTLTVSDKNGQKLKKPYKGGDYYYELHFSDGSTLDPVITNGGCCNAVGAQSYLPYLAIGVVALAVLYVLLVRPMMAKRDNNPPA